MRMRHALLAAVALAAAALATAVPAQAAETVRFGIYKDGDPIGQEVYTFDEGPDGQLTVDVAARTDVQVLFLKFHYDHARTEVWQDGALRTMTARTDDDGTPHQIALTREDDGWRVQSDGEMRTETAEALPLTLWTPKVLESSRVLSVIDAEPWDVTVEKVGPEPVGGRDAVHWRMTGGVDRDLWYAPDGDLLKVAFTRQGYEITYVRE